MQQEKGVDIFKIHKFVCGEKCLTHFNAKESKLDKAWLSAAELTWRSTNGQPATRSELNEFVCSQDDAALYRSTGGKHRQCQEEGKQVNGVLNFRVNKALCVDPQMGQYFIQYCCLPCYLALQTPTPAPTPAKAPTMPTPLPTPIEISPWCKKHPTKCVIPTFSPTSHPSFPPSHAPTLAPTADPTLEATVAPTAAPTAIPTQHTDDDDLSHSMNIVPSPAPTYDSD